MDAKNITLLNHFSSIVVQHATYMQENISTVVILRHLHVTSDWDNLYYEKL